MKPPVCRHRERENYLSIGETVQHRNQESLKGYTRWLVQIERWEQNWICMRLTYLKRAEGEVDEVPRVAIAALHVFIYQHSEDHFMDSQQRNEDQCRPGQTKGHT